MTPYNLLKIKPPVSRLHPMCLSFLTSLFVMQWGTIKVIPLPPPCSPPRDLLNVIHCHLICDEECNGSGKLEGTVLCRHGGVPFRIIVDCQIASRWRGPLKEVPWCVFPSWWSARSHVPKASDNRAAFRHVLVSFNIAFTLISGSVGYMDGIAAVLLN